MEYGRPYAPTAYYIYMRGSCDVVKGGLFLLCYFLMVNLILGWGGGDRSSTQNNYF